jgi:alpha-galactosidase
MKKQSGGDVTKSSPIMRDAYMKMHLALVATGRPITYSLCQYGMDNV